MSTPLTPKLTHVADGLRRLLTKEKDSVLFRGLVESYLRRIQEVEDTAWLVLDSRTLEGEGAQLDALGRLLKQARGELGDSDYRLALRARIRILRSNGTAPDLQDVADLSVPDGFSHDYEEAYPKTSLVSVIGAVDFAIAVLLRNLLRAKPAGTKLYLAYDETDTPYLHSVTDDEDDDEDHGDGNDDEDAAPGGHLSNILSS
jgi:hypothetical protein